MNYCTYCINPNLSHTLYTIQRASSHGSTVPFGPCYNTKEVKRFLHYMIKQAIFSHSICQKQNNDCARSALSFSRNLTDFSILSSIVGTRHKSCHMYTAVLIIYQDLPYLTMEMETENLLYYRKV